MKSYKAGELHPEREVYLASDVTELPNYEVDAREAAADAVRYFDGEIVDQLVEFYSAATYIDNYSQRYHHETHVDRFYNLQEAAKLLSDLEDYQETDRGLWERQKPTDAISTMAAYTFGAAVHHFFGELIGQINEEFDIDEFINDDGDVDEDAARKAAEELVHQLANEFDPTTSKR